MFVEPPPNANNGCRFCGRVFSSRSGRDRHIRSSCTVANTDEGIAQLAERTSKRQIDALITQVGELTTQLQRLAEQPAVSPVAAPAPVAISAGNSSVNMAGCANNTIHNGDDKSTTNNTTINIYPWDVGALPVSISRADLVAAYHEDHAVGAYCTLDQESLADAASFPAAAEAMVSLVKRAHADPAARNVYLNPKRADQALVFTRAGEWVVLTLEEATRALLDGVATSICAIMIDSSAGVAPMPSGLTTTASYIPLCYRSDVATFVDNAKRPMAAHLSNTAPTTAVAPDLSRPPRQPPAVMKAEPLPARPAASGAAPDRERLSADDALALLTSYPRRPDEDAVSYTWRLSARSGKSAYRIAAKLWEAVSDGADSATAREIVAAKNADPMCFDD